MKKSVNRGMNQNSIINLAVGSAMLFDLADPRDNDFYSFTPGIAVMGYNPDPADRSMNDTTLAFEPDKQEVGLHNPPVSGMPNQFVGPSHPEQSLGLNRPAYHMTGSAFSATMSGTDYSTGQCALLMSPI
jgi:hypothetical protein